LYQHYATPESAPVVVRRRIREFVAADKDGLSNALSSRLVMEVLPLLNASLATARAKNTALRRAFVAREVPSGRALTKDDHDRLLRQILSDDENAAMLAERAHEEGGSLRAAVATYFRALAQRWTGVGDTVDVAAVRLVDDQHAIVALAVTAREVVALRVVLGLVVERGTWKVDELLVGPAEAPIRPEARSERTETTL
jgi:hypothetical protein